jgi:hypothetical protein
VSTESGRRLVNDVREVVVHGVTDRIRPGFDLAWHVERGVAAIEQEVRDAIAIGTSKHQPGDPHDYDLRCKTCGEHGTIRVLVDPQNAPDTETP